MYSSMLYMCNSYIDDIDMLHSTGPSASGANDCPLIKDTPNMARASLGLDPMFWSD